MTTAFEERIKDDLSTLARRVPNTPDALDEVRPGVTRRRRRRVATKALGVLAVAAAVLFTTGVIVQRKPETRPPAFQPTGIETPLTLDPAGGQPPQGWLIKPGSFVRLTRPGLPDLQVYESVFLLEGHVVKVHCSGEAVGGAGCDPYIDTIPRSVSITSTVDNGTGSTDSWIWSGLPPDAKYVEFVAGEVSLWQTPVAGTAAFPVGTPGDPVGAFSSVSAVAYDEQGIVVARSDDSPNTADLPDSDSSQLTQEQRNQLRVVIDSSITSCLSANGDAWDYCVAAADTAVTDWIIVHATEPAPTSTSP